MALIVHEFVSLDGVFEIPSWTAEFGFAPEMGETLGRVMIDATALLLGRVTFEMFGPGWRDRTPDDDPGAPFFNDSTKHVVTSTLTDPLDTWQNSQVLGAYDAEAIRALKESTDGDLYTSGSGTLVRAMLADGLVDSLHLFVYPVALGGGKRLFPEGSGRTTLALRESETYSNGVVHLAYGPA